MFVAAATFSIVIVQRQTVEWTKLSDEEFFLQSKKFCRLWGKPDDYIWNIFQLWNKTFRIDYRDVRQKLKNLSLKNIQEAKDITFVHYNNYRSISENQGYYLFLDDDDWIDPNIYANLGEKLHGFREFPELLLWRSANVGSPQQEHIVFVWGMNGRCMTNNYAVHSSWLRPFSKIHQILQHKDAAVIFEKNDDAPHLDCALTVSNKSPISSVSLDRGLAGELTSSRLIKLVENYLERMSYVQDSELSYIPWSREYLEKTIRIFEGVLQGKR